jgi:hypothetical protein
MRAALPDLSPLDRLHIRPWTDPVIDSVGHDPRSTYVETFWLGVLGPSTVWLLRRLATGLDAEPEGFDLPLAETARALGLGGEGRHSPFVRALARCVQFDLASPDGQDGLAVRRRLPPLNRRQLVRLPESVQEAHRRWVEADLATPPAERLRQRARRLALSLLELGETLDETERQLLRWRFHPALSHEAARWAWDRHVQARAAAGDPAPPAIVATGPGTAPRVGPDGPAAA